MMNAAARAYAMDKVIAMLKGHPSYGDATKYREPLGDRTGYQFDNPEEEMEGLEDLLKHLRTKRHQCGTAGSVRAEIQARIPLACGHLSAVCDCKETPVDDGVDVYETPLDPESGIVA